MLETKGKVKWAAGLIKSGHVYILARLWTQAQRRTMILAKQTSKA